MFVKKLNLIGRGNIDCIPNTEEKYISFSKSIYQKNIFQKEKTVGKKSIFKYKIRFIDSSRFIKTCRELVGNLNEDRFNHVKRVFGNVNSDD